MTELNRAGVDESLGHIDTTQGEFRDQIDVVADELRQLAGNADVPGDALSAPYVLYVNGYTGKDTFVGGDYHTQVNAIEERISLQRLECGYTEARPFKTINRAALEAAIITSHEDFATDAERGRALVSIQVAPGEYTVLNGNGLADTDANFPARTTGFEPTDAELQSFNDDTTGGVILPRGTSLVSLDLRKTILRPNTVPAVANEAANYSNRRSILKVTGTGYYYGFTFKDQAGSTASHHLLSCFEFTPQAQLNAFYSKIRKSFAFMDISDANAVAEEKEYQIVGAQPANPTPDVDTVGSASPYIYNISNRSVLGLCGIFADGDNSAGFRSMVVAQYTGVSLQTDFSCWQIYNQGTNTWGAASSQQAVIDAEPDDVRMHPSRRSFHIRAVNDSVIQEVSVFAIGQGIHHWVEAGGELTVTNSNSNWGGCAALAEGFHDTAAPGDTPFTPLSVRRALSPFEKTQNIEIIFLGTVAAGVANNAVAIDLVADLQESTAFPDQPAVLANKGYSLKEDDLIWVENGQGADYSAELAANPWSGNDPNRITIQAAFVTPGGDAPGSGNSFPALAGRRIYVRRLVDTRTVEERTYSLKVSGTQDRRLPVRDYVIRDAANSWATTRLSSVSRSTVDKTGAGLTADVVLRNANHIAADLAHATTTYYHKGDPIILNNKHLTAVRDNYGTFDADDWSENFVHMQDGFAPEGVVKNSQPIIIFDGDTDNTENTADCGFNIGTPIIEAQYESGTDYKGLSYFLTTAGINIALTPTTAAQRDAAIANGAGIEFRRPSNIRLFGHAYEWAGFLNYSKALPQYQGDLSPTNRFTYYFTNEEGGKVYASGFNEEGFAVTPQGLQDIETGEVRSVVDIGSPDVLIPEPPQLPVSATTTLQGLVELATPAEVAAAAAGNVTLIGESGPLVLQPNAIPSIVNAVGLLNDAQTHYYVAANIADVPDADVAADAVTVGDAQTTATRKAALYCTNIADAFTRIAGRSSVSGRQITIRLYTATNSDTEVTYAGDTALYFENGRTPAGISAEHSIGSIFITGNSAVKLQNVSLRFTRRGISSDKAVDITVYGGSYRTVSTVEAYHAILNTTGKVVLFSTNQRDTTQSVSTTFEIDIDVNAAYLFSEHIRCASFFWDSRRPNGSVRPTFTIRNSADGPTASCFVRCRDRGITYFDPGPGNRDFTFNFNLDLTGTTGALFYMFAPLTATAPNISLYSQPDSAVITTTVPANITTFVSIDYAGYAIPLIYEGAATLTRFWGALAVSTAASGANLTAANSFVYRVGAASTVNNVLKETGETLNSAGTISNVSVDGLVDAEIAASALVNLDNPL